ncbi:hypothetical protein TIFTF001_003778 [Ficus carica]|uniref:Uncharacterized protein n=1 Tax=Ficus carica TaxID=3494 RepID=A0AA87ZIH4_FICCA|nr:hypothetical protein TIFTF001_003778 [Ficus carica]
MSSSSASTLSLDHLPPSEQLCYVHCNICDTVLAVSVPCTSLFKTVTVRCGHCTNLLPEEIPNPAPNFLMNQTSMTDFAVPPRGVTHDHHELSRPPVINRPPEKRQRVPSAYNRFIK